MKTLFIATLLSMNAFADQGILRRTKLGPANSTSTVTIAAAPTGVKNCLTELDVQSSAAFTVSVVDGATTIYSLTFASAGVVVRSWDDANALCGTTATQLQITVSAGTYNINYQGFTY